MHWKSRCGTTSYKQNKQGAIHNQKLKPNPSFFMNRRQLDRQQEKQKILNKLADQEFIIGNQPLLFACCQPRVP